jgi:TrmH family RNA methyltransferase
MLREPTTAVATERHPRRGEHAVMKHITSRQNPLVARFRAVAHGDDRSLIMLDGAHLVTDSLDVDLALHYAVVSPEALAVDDIAELVDRIHAIGIEVISASPSVMAALSPVRSPSGIVALADRPAGGEARMFDPVTPVVVCAVDVQDPGNVGAIVRVAEAGGATGVVTTGRSADPFGWKALRGSMGSGLRMPIASRPDTTAAIDEMRRHGCRIVVTVPRGGRPFDQVVLDGPIALIVGSEGSGLPGTALAAADERVTIPMTAPVESLNTAVCAALMVFEARRQRTIRHHTSSLPASQK